MGLSDIDEDEPVAHSPSRPIVLAPPPSAARTAPAGAPHRHQYTISPTASLSGGGSVLDDLFGDVDIDASPGSARSGRSAHPHASPTSMSSSTGGKPPASTTAAAAKAATASSVLDDLFAAPMPLSTKDSSAVAAGGATTGVGSGGHESHAVLYVDGSGAGAEEDGTNLFDLSKPVKKQKYNNAESFLDAFERQGKKGIARVDQSETLAHLTRNKDDNKVRARLLALMNYYDVLGVAQSASEEEIKRSYKKKALELHPDRVGRDQTQEEAELFKVITKAHEVLTDAEQRRTYDASLRSSDPAATAASPNDWWSHVNM